MEMNLQAGTIEKPFLKTAIAFRGDIHPFQPFPKASAREAYETLPAALKNRLVKMGGIPAKLCIPCDPRHRLYAF